jgi:hypothetical protein
MKIHTLLTLLAAGISIAPMSLAFPAFANMKEADIRAMMEKRSGGIPQASPLQHQRKRQLQIPTVGRKQIPDEDHQFIAPSSTAQRGPW